MTEDEEFTDMVFSEVVAELFEREATHWELEYEAIARKYGSTGRVTKPMAAFKLGATMLRNRAPRIRAAR